MWKRLNIKMPHQAFGGSTLGFDALKILNGFLMHSTTDTNHGVT